MGVCIRKAQVSDGKLITFIMRDAFNFDTEYYFGEGEKGDPNGYDDGTLATKILENQTLISYIIQKEETDCGLIVYREDSNIINTLEYFCVLSKYINEGIGTETWKIIELLQQNKTWFLETPSYSLRNHKFYEKQGFRKYGEKDYGAAKSFQFKK